MKKRLLLFCAALLIAVLFCGCGEEKAEAAAEKVGEQAATIASEVKENVEGMIEDATVRDGDGYIGDHDRSTEAATQPVTVPTEVGTDDGVFDDPLDPEPTVTEDDND